MQMSWKACGRSEIWAWHRDDAVWHQSRSPVNCLKRTSYWNQWVCFMPAQERDEDIWTLLERAGHMKIAFNTGEKSQSACLKYIIYLVWFQEAPVLLDQMRIKLYCASKWLFLWPIQYLLVTHKVLIQVNRGQLWRRWNICFLALCVPWMRNVWKDV